MKHRIMLILIGGSLLTGCLEEKVDQMTTTAKEENLLNENEVVEQVPAGELPQYEQEDEQLRGDEPGESDEEKAESFYLPSQTSVTYFGACTEDVEDRREYSVEYKDIQDGYVSGLIRTINTAAVPFVFYEDSTGLYEVDAHHDKKHLVSYPAKKGSSMTYEMLQKDSENEAAYWLTRTIEVLDVKEGSVELLHTTEVEGVTLEQTWVLEKHTGFIQFNEYCIQR
ncbi:hypothetical protein Q75_16480 [Bacillus coahuilensis p1.1.43]|uniref:Lipoprotein n=1 Tax=Bacillus coahuilensis p1.1.43 TaxID=1150625 RepID=A0A147K4D9_9BACI|nr:hypothetical protein [Bacillus coahuilensis]KUP04180.1 hypothetical protein Q75_16480 [Bacillus coahuilensis p1.1.43]